MKTLKEKLIAINLPKERVITCDVCGKPLTNPQSQVAGKGLQCGSYIRYAETMDRSELSGIEGEAHKVESYLNLI